MTKRRVRKGISDSDIRAIHQVVDRVLLHFPDRERRDVFMDITATIAGGCRLRLDELLVADDFNFVHDIVGIERHLDRQTFELKDCFVPRFAEQ